MTNKMIYDQASGLRRLTQPSVTKVISVTGGKGGVGKSNVTLGMAICMAKQAKKSWCLTPTWASLMLT